MLDLGTIRYAVDQRRAFRQGRLWRDWIVRYPELFDEDDQRLAESQAGMGYHFFEWLGAVVLYTTTGFRALVEPPLFMTSPAELWRAGEGLG